MSNYQNSKKYDLDDRTYAFAKQVISYTKNLPRNDMHYELIKQVLRSSGSVGANYIEANEAISKKDFIFRIKICRKEAKETKYWISLTEPAISQIDQKNLIIKEAIELTKIFGAIVEKMRSDKL